MIGNALEDRIAWRGVCQEKLRRVQNAGTHTAQFVCATRFREKLRHC